MSQNCQYYRIIKSVVILRSESLSINYKENKIKSALAFENKAFGGDTQGHKKQRHKRKLVLERSSSSTALRQIKPQENYILYASTLPHRSSSHTSLKLYRQNDAWTDSGVKQYLN